MDALGNSRTVEMVGGLQLNVLEDGRGDPVLVLHGTGDPEGDGALLAALSEHSAVSYPLHPGFGSERPSWFRRASDLAYLYLSLLRDGGSPAVKVVGLQFGAWIAAEMAIRDDSLISSLVLVDPVGIRISEPRVRDIADMFATPRAEFARLTVASAEARVENLANVSPERAERIAQHEEGTALYGWEPYLHNPALRYWLHRISRPTLVVRGERDGVVSEEYCRTFANEIAGASYEECPEAGHYAQVDQPEWLARRIREFSARP